MARSLRLDLVPPDGGPPREPAWTAGEVVERLRAVVPGLEPLSVVALPGERIGELEPSLGTGALGIIDRPIAWIVTGLDAAAAGGDPPIRLTYLLVDGTAEAYESAPWDVANVGFVPFTLVGTPLASDQPSPTSSPSPPSAHFPTKVLDLGVASVGKAIELHPQFDDAELAISGWYVSPDPAATCPGLRDQIRPVRPPCNEGRAWLLDQPEPLWSDPRKTGIDRQPSGAYLNPIVPSDVAFDLPNQWSAESPELLPVVVVGHFADPRVTDTYAGNTYFVVDQLVWASGETMPDRVVRLVSDTVESGADVMARIDRALGPSNTTWTSLVRGSDLSVLDEGAADAAPELAEAATVWVVRRLVMAESDGATRLVMETAFTPDRSERVWSRRGCCGLELATTIDVRLPPAGGGGGLLEIADRTRTVVSARIVAGGSYTDWRPVGPKEGWWIEVAAGDSPRELAIRWTADRCETTWSLTVEQGPWLDLTRPFVEGCDVRTGAQRAIVVTFDHPIDIDDVRANDNTSGG